MQIMIVYKRILIKKDFNNQNENGIMYIKTDNVGYMITQKDNDFFKKKKKIFNNQLISERRVKTIDQVIKIVN